LVHDGLYPTADLIDFPSGDVVCDHIAWTSFHPENLQTCTADVVALVAAPDPRHAAFTFNWLSTHPAPGPTIAVVPERVHNPSEDQLLQLAMHVADDFVVWPVRPLEWRHRILRLLGHTGQQPEAATDRLAGELALMKLVGKAPAFTQAISRIPVLARSGRPVLITGETGTGKELCARAIHHFGRRRHAPFIPVDCAAVPDHLFENELFGHARGAFTDARGDQKGLIAIADGGTLFLDEIDALPMAVQPKLLRFLQERTFKPLGSDRFVSADVNVLAATNRNIEALVRQQRFRSDLYFRVNVLSLHLEPLRQRTGDVPLLAQHFADAICAEQSLARKTLSAQAARKLELHTWPGNVRELHNVMQRAVIFSERGLIRPCHVVLSHSEQPQSELAGVVPFNDARTHALELFERAYVEDVLLRHDGNITRAARYAHKERRTFGRLVKKYGLRNRGES
jgi:DNA-binding NtrC family response regulator